jgi:hypothetical protein
MEIEAISEVEILDSEEMYIVLASGGKPMYQHIYREAAEVYWDDDIKGFKAPPPRKWSHSEWFHHIVSVAASGLGISLELSSNTKWVNVSTQTKAEVCAKKNT